MKVFYIVVYRYSPSERWNVKIDGAFPERHLAEKLAEVCQYQNPTWQYAIVDGAIVSPETAEEAEQRLGEF